jgi:hypothetical protein
MIKPRGAKAQRRKPKAVAPTQRSKGAKKSGALKASLRGTSARHGISEAVSGADVNWSNEPQTIPRSLASRWIAWSADGLRIVASGETLKDAEVAASQAGESEPIFERAGGTLRR